MKQMTYSILFFILGILLVYESAPMDLLGGIIIFSALFLFIQGIHKTGKEKQREK